MGVLRRAQGSTAYAVRQIFRASISAEWSGSAGAVYPAIARLKGAKLLTAQAQKDGRGTVTYALSAAGVTAHDTWLCDVERAVGPGLDPFRTRAGLWRELAPEKRRALMKALKKEIEQRREALRRAPPNADPAEAISEALHLALLDLRLHWLEKQ